MFVRVKWDLHILLLLIIGSSTAKASLYTENHQSLFATFNPLKQVTMKEDLSRLFLLEIKRRLTGEGQERILRCLDLLTEEEIWYRPNAHSNSVGNLVLHLCGNVTQWLFSTVGGQEDLRKRQAEFDEKGPISREKLKRKVIDLMAKADQIINDIDYKDLTRIYSVQGFQESGVAILIHITEHFSYHVGQITYFVKARKDIDVGYYAGLDLDQIAKPQDRFHQD